MRRSGSVLLGLAAGLAVAAPAGAADRTVRVSWSIVTETRIDPGGGCESAAFLQVTEVPGARSYAVDVFDTNPRVNSGSTRTGPPFDGDNAIVGGQIVPAPAGTHRWGLSSGGAANGDCSGFAGFLDPSRWRVSRAVAIVDGRARILGTVTDTDGRGIAGVAIRIQGPTGATVRTNAAGAYAKAVRRGRYTVSAPSGLCVEGTRSCTNRRTLRVSGPESVSFAKRTVRLSGTVQGSRCTPDHCDLGALAGVLVTAEGSGDPASATTTEDGRWQLDVPTGSWRVSASFPGRVFSPGFERVLADRDRDGIDFSTCELVTATRAAGREPTRMESPTACDPDDLDWTMPDRLDQRSPRQWDAEYGLPHPGDVNPQFWTARLFFRKGGERFRCIPGTRWTFAVRAPRGARVLDRPGPGCGGQLKVDRLGTYQVTATKQERTDRGWRDTDTRAIQDVEVRDFLIVGMGDSNGSGEGNPPFYFPRCNRSVASYQYLVAESVEAFDPRSSVTFVHASCSGASIQHLTGRGYAGIRPQAPDLAPQIEQVNDELRYATANEQPVRRVDALLLSIGVNNLEFGAIMEFCALNSTRDEGCQFRKVVGQAPVQPWRVDHYRADERRGEPIIHRLGRLLRQLPSRYPALQHALAGAVRGGGLAVRGDRVFLAEYPDFSRDDDGTTCDGLGEPGGSVVDFNRQTWAWLGDAANRLNAAVREGAGTAGWTAVPTSTEFLTHGYCADDAYFRGIAASVWAANKPGAFHPDNRGHFLELQQTLPLVCRRLLGNDRCSSD